MNLKSLHKVKDEDLEVNRKHVVRGASIHISIHMSYQAWSLPSYRALPEQVIVILNEIRGCCR